MGISRGRFPSAGFVKCSAAAEPLDRYRGLALPARAFASRLLQANDPQVPRLHSKFRCACVSGCCVVCSSVQMAAADLQSAVLEMFAGLEADERLAGQGLAEGVFA